MSAAGSANGSLVASARGSTWPWGETIGKPLVSSYNSRATRRTAGSGSKQRSGSRSGAAILDDRSPAGLVLALPQPHGLVVARDVTRGGIDPQRAPGRLGDVAQVAQQDALRALHDRLMQRRAGADRIHEVVDVQPGHVVVGAEVEAVPARGGERLLHGLALQIVHRVAVAVHDGAAPGAKDGGAPAAVEGFQAVTALPLPDDGLAAGELEAGFLSVGELPVVVEVVAASRRRDPGRKVHAERPPGDVDLVRAVIADLARAPAVKPVPVVVDDVVAVGRVRRRPLPQLVVQVGRHRRPLPASDTRPGVGVPGAPQIRLADDPLADRLDQLDGTRGGALLRAHLDDALMLALRLDEQLALMRVVPARFLHVDVLAGLHGQQRRRRVPVVGRGDHQGVHGLVLERFAEIAQPSRRLALHASHVRHRLGEDLGVDIADVGYGGVRRPRERAGEYRAAPVQAHHGDDDLLGGRTQPGREGRPACDPQSGGRGGLQEFAALHSSLTLMLRKKTSSPWSCSTMCPLRRVAKPGIGRNLLLAMSESKDGVPSSNSTIFAPLSQCSPWLPRNASFDSFHSPTGRRCFCALGAMRSYRAPARCVGSLPSSCRSSSRIWYSNPRAAWFGACAMDSSSDTLYLTPLFAPGVTFHSQLSSKSPNVSTVIRSPPCAGCPSAILGTLPVAILWIAPSCTFQCAVGTLSYPRPRQPLRVRPSNSSRHPAARSAGVSRFCCARLGARLCAGSTPAVRGRATRTRIEDRIMTAAPRLEAVAP